MGENRVDESYEFKLKTKRGDIDFINKIMEAYEGVGVVRTKNADEGDLTVVTTRDFKEDVRAIIEDLDSKWVDVKIVWEGKWTGSL